jgi:hypothetical protein
MPSKEEKHSGIIPEMKSTKLHIFLRLIEQRHHVTLLICIGRVIERILRRRNLSGIFVFCTFVVVLTDLVRVKFKIIHNRENLDCCLLGYDTMKTRR